ncbi:MAG TPA: hypothetical protein VKD45_07900, partial [Hyphomicrobiaceae bacterium]|nr:hypothetical protein [Hyphomicrobiaceae bacterium]
VDPLRLPGYQQKVWLALLRALKPAPFVLERLIKLRESGRMPPELAHILADETKVARTSE